MATGLCCPKLNSSYKSSINTSVDDLPCAACARITGPTAPANASGDTITMSLPDCALCQREGWFCRVPTAEAMRESATAISVCHAGADGLVVDQGTCIST